MLTITEEIEEPIAILEVCSVTVVSTDSTTLSLFGNRNSTGNEFTLIFEIGSYSLNYREFSLNLS